MCLPVEPPLSDAACAHERRVLHVELDAAHVVLAYAPNSGRPGRLAFRIDQWEPCIRALLRELGAAKGQSTPPKPVVLQGDLNVAHVRALDAWGTTDAQFGGYKASGRTREEQAAFDTMLAECGLVDGFRYHHPDARSPTCWAQKAAGAADQREHWKRYDYALVSRSLVEGVSIGGHQAVRLTDVRHRGDAFEGGRPDHTPVESIFEWSSTCSSV